LKNRNVIAKTLKMYRYDCHGCIVTISFKKLWCYW